jgi:hypothetical protein
VLEALDKAQVDRDYLSPAYLRKDLAAFLQTHEHGVFWLQAPAHIGKTTFVQGLTEAEIGDTPIDPRFRSPKGGMLVAYYCRKEYGTGLPDMVNSLQDQLNCASSTSIAISIWNYQQTLGLTDLKVTPDPVLIAGEGALWGAIRHQGLLQDTVIVSDDASQFRVGIRAVLGARRTPRPQAGSRQRQTAQRHRGRQADDLVVLRFPEGIQAGAQPAASQGPACPLRPHLQSWQNQLNRLRNG